MWQEHQKQGMQALINGDNDSAIRHWIEAVTAAIKSNAPATADLAELYYCLGKALADLRRDNEAADYLRTAVSMHSTCNSGEHKLKVAQYALAEVLTRTGSHEEATAQFKQAYDLPEHVTFEAIPLKTAIKALQKAGLCKELKGGVLTNLCHETELDPDEDNSDLPALLLAYYCDEHRGDKRSFEDKFFFDHYTQFETENVLARLNILSEHELLVLEDQDGDTRDGDFISLTLRRDDGETIYRSCSSVVGIVDEFNDQLALRDGKSRFCSLNYQNYFVAYFMDTALQNKLHEARALNFDEIFNLS